MSPTHQTEDSASLPGASSPRRRELIRLDISRTAARLFVEQGLAATSGEQIAVELGLSVRTLWRYFRNKESCVEPIIARNVHEQLEILRRWPADLGLEEHVAAELARRKRTASATTASDDLLSVQLVGLADAEPAIRASWLMACDEVEHGLVEIVATRLHRPRTDRRVRIHAAAAAAAIRAINEDVSRTLLAGIDTGNVRRVDAGALARRLAQAVRTATGDALGDPV